MSFKSNAGCFIVCSEVDSRWPMAARFVVGYSIHCNSKPLRSVGVRSDFFKRAGVDRSRSSCGNAGAAR